MRLEAVGKRYGLRQPWIVRDVSLDLPAGRLIRLEGRNGSGKSTLMRVLAGACLPSAGQVTGRPRTGYVPERFPPGLPFSPRAYLTHLGRVHGIRDADLAGHVEECLDRLGAAPYAGAPMRSLSKGMCQKVAVAQALLARPGLLVLDEAWTGLDQAARGVLDDAVAQRLTDGSAVVFVDHDSQRLAGLVAERWQVAAGRVEVAAGAASGVVLIEVSGLSQPAVSGLAGMPGILLVRAVGERVQISVEPAASDTVLRTLLGGGPVHVLSVSQAGTGRVMMALVRYQAAVLLRAHRWVGPLLLYATLLAFVGAGQPLRSGLGWSAAMLVPAVAWLTRSALTAEPAAARACVAVAGGPHRAHLAALLTALGFGVILAVAGAGYEVASCKAAAGPAALAGALAAGLAGASVCLLVGSAVGTLCNPPVVRHPAVAALVTVGAVVVALAADVSPANAALRGSTSVPQAPAWLPGLPLLVALALAAASWAISTLLAARRG